MTLYDSILSKNLGPEINDFEWVEAFSINQPQLVKIAEKPISKNPQIKKFFLSEYIQKLSEKQGKSFLWTEGLLVPSFIKINYQPFSYSQPIQSDEHRRLEAYFQRSQLDLVICHIHNRVGFGVFTLEFIPKGTIVTVYSGKLFSDRDISQLSHAKYTFYLPANFVLNFGVDEIDNYLKDKKHFQSKHFSQIAAEDCGNIARFIQSLPTPEEALTDNFIIENRLFEKIMLNNLEDHFTLYNGWPVIYLEATKDIQAGEQLGYSYGSLYWKYMQEIHGFKQAFFDRDGNIL